MLSPQHVCEPLARRSIGVHGIYHYIAHRGHGCIGGSDEQFGCGSGGDGVVICVEHDRGVGESNLLFPRLGLCLTGKKKKNWLVRSASDVE